MPDKPDKPTKRGSAPQPGVVPRRAVSLLTALTFLVLAVTGVIAFILPFSLDIIGLHALMGFIFIGLIALHALNNSRQLRGYLRSRTFWAALAATGLLSILFWWQPAPVRAVLGWSGNLGPAMERFEMSEHGMVFDYAPSPQYRMRLTVKPGPSYHVDPPPEVAIWLENQDGYHIKTLLAPGDAGETPYWNFKLAGWEQAKREAETAGDGDPGEIDAVSSPTPNASFDPADYILPSAQSADSTPYRLLLEINQPGDGQASLVHVVDIDNRLPRTFQLLELHGYPRREDDDDRERWGLYFIDETFDTALDLIDSALLTIERVE